MSYRHNFLVTLSPIYCQYFFHFCQPKIRLCHILASTGHRQVSPVRALLPSKATFLFMKIDVTNNLEFSSQYLVFEM